MNTFCNRSCMHVLFIDSWTKQALDRDWWASRVVDFVTWFMKQCAARAELRPSRAPSGTQPLPLPLPTPLLACQPTLSPPSRSLSTALMILTSFLSWAWSGESSKSRSYTNVS